MNAKDSLLDFISQYVTLTDEEARELLSLDLFREYEKGAVLSRESNPTQLSFFLLKGCVAKCHTADSDIVVTEIYTDNENVVDSHDGSDHHLRFLEDSVVSAASDETMDEYMGRIPKLEAMCRMMAEHVLSDVRLSFDQYRLATPEQRYRRIMEERPDLLQRVPQYYLASYVGVKPESLSRIRKRMASRAEEPAAAEE
ncbi:Crp/Fnr family transcriptional regulator [Rubrivirga sp.]|uniref:Crp/Fnr family transcriptional regulator n=1 Tax=Rubrivirga sp. TaxID=1885344 RepID=UPI003C752831